MMKLTFVNLEYGIGVDIIGGVRYIKFFDGNAVVKIESYRHIPVESRVYKFIEFGVGEIIKRKLFSSGLFKSTKFGVTIIIYEK